MTISQDGPTRKEKFEAALRLAGGWTYADWSKNLFPVSRVHLRCVLMGERAGNELLNQTIDRFIADQFARLSPNDSRDTQDVPGEAA